MTSIHSEREKFPDEVAEEMAAPMVTANVRIALGKKIRPQTSRRREEYDRLNTVLPCPLPSLTGPEAIAAFKLLHRKFLGRPYKGQIKICSGNRHDRYDGGVLHINPERGWESLCHSASHFIHRCRHPGDRPHSQRHLDLEFAIVRHVKEMGWLGGRLKRPTKPKVSVDIRTIRYEGVLKRLATWHAKLKRAQRAIQKLNLRRRYYEKTFAGTAQSQMGPKEHADV